MMNLCVGMGISLILKNNDDLFLSICADAVNPHLTKFLKILMEIDKEPKKKKFSPQNQKEEVKANETRERTRVRKNRRQKYMVAVR